MSNDIDLLPIQVISQDDARALGRLTFFTGVPCLRSHISPRYVSNGCCRECFRTRRARKQAEEGTENNYKRRAKYERERRAKKGSNKGMSKKLYLMGRARRQVSRARTPPWLTSDEGKELKQFGRSKPPGMVSDHIVPLSPIGGEIFGIHTSENLQYLTGRQNAIKGNRLEGEPAEHVKAGRAIWAADVDEDNRVNWQPYVGDRLAPILSAIAKEFGAESFTLADLAAKGMTTEKRWLNGNVGLLSGGYRLVDATGLDGAMAWRLTPD